MYRFGGGREAGGEGRRVGGVVLLHCLQNVEQFLRPPVEIYFKILLF